MTAAASNRFLIFIRALLIGVLIAASPACDDGSLNSGNAREVDHPPGSGSADNPPVPGDSGSGSSSSSGGAPDIPDDESGGGHEIPAPPEAGEPVDGQGGSTADAYRQRLEELANSALVCEAGELLRADMRQPALYATVDGACIPADPAGPGQLRYFSDPMCGREIAFRPASYSDYCAEIMSHGRANARLGNAASWIEDATQPNDPAPGTPSRKWTLAHGARLALSAESLNGKTAPFMKRLRYRNVLAAGGMQGICSLEMRVYKKDLNATGLTPLLAFHGGGWRYRGGAFVGFEAQLAHYTEDGFIVFAPFYRLAGDADGNSECNGAAWNAITADAEAALAWVRRHAVAFGARPGSPAVMGQSAGAHLAGWLLAHRPAEVAAGLLLYGPTDVRDFLAQAVPPGGLYHERYGRSLDLLSGFFGSDVRALDPGADIDFVRLNSYHDYVHAGGVPPVFLIHGSADTVVPSNQSVLMCNAYGGTAVDHGGGPLRRATYGCGETGRLHLFQQGGHGLDGCWLQGLVEACVVGDELSRLLLVDSLEQAREWLHGRGEEK